MRGHIKELPLDLITFDEEEKPEVITHLKTERVKFYPLKIKSLDNLLGGGIYSGSVILLGGKHGIGKSTLALQLGARFSQKYGFTLYISSEETIKQLNLKIKRLKIREKYLYLFTKTELTEIIDYTLKLNPKLLILDSINRLYDERVNALPGSYSQLKAITLEVISLARSKELAIILISHLTKSGKITGPSLLEHLVDVVLYLEGKPEEKGRYLFSPKNRFGIIQKKVKLTFFPSGFKF